MHDQPTTDDVRQAYLRPLCDYRDDAEERFERWLDGVRAAARREGQAEAWDEGWEAYHKFMGRGIFPPYRTGADQ